MKFKRRITKTFIKWISITKKLLGYGSTYGGAYGAYGAYGAKSFAAPALGYGNKYCKKNKSIQRIFPYFTWEKHLWNWVTLCSVTFSSLSWFSQFKQSFWMPFSQENIFYKL